MKNIITRRPVVKSQAVARWIKLIYGSGVDACYNHVSKHWGFKWFRREGDCTRTYVMQRIAAEDGVGPQIGPLVKFMQGRAIRYGYLTQRATPIKECLREWGTHTWADTFYDDYDYDGDEVEHRCQQYTDMGCADFLGWSYRREIVLDDIHLANIGYLTTTGRGVIIDYGHFYPMCSSRRYYENLYEKVSQEYQDYT